ncbi:hypothetical protein C7S14_0610 [Burkholderia cepacia]|nr:hypothetical protein C7S14_0610 [Burkholderia cepacia]
MGSRSMSSGSTSTVRPNCSGGHAGIDASDDNLIKHRALRICFYFMKIEKK